MRDAFSGCKGLIIIPPLCDLRVENQRTFISNEKVLAPLNLKNKLQSSLPNILFYENIEVLNGRYGKETLKKIQISADTQSIPDNFFRDCSKLEEIIFSTNIKKIGESAFYGCTSLKMVDLSNCLEIGKAAFSRCLSLEYVSLSEEIDTISMLTFSECKSLRNVNLNNTIQTIGSDAFYSCTSLDNIILPESIKKIGKYAFANCSSLKQINIPDSVNIIPYGCFSGCNNLEKVYMKNVEVIQEKAFTGCSNLKSLKLPFSIKDFTYYAFDEKIRLVVPKNKYGLPLWRILQVIYERISIEKDLDDKLGCLVSIIILSLCIVGIFFYNQFWMCSLVLVTLLGAFSLRNLIKGLIYYAILFFIVWILFGK